MLLHRKTLILALLVVMSCSCFADKNKGTVSSKNSGCKIRVDVVFVLDGSDSIDDRDMVKMKQFVADVISGFNMEKDTARIGALVYSTKVAAVIGIGSTHSSKILVNAIKKLPHPKDGTNTDRGIEKMIKMFADKSKPHVPKVGIVITDGRSKNPRLTLSQARRAQKAGITMLAVGVGRLIDKNELKTMSMNGAIWTVESFSKLQQLTKEIGDKVCAVTTTTPALTTTTTTPAPTTTTTTPAPTTTTTTPAPTTTTTTPAPTTTTTTPAPTTTTTTPAPTTTTTTPAPTTTTTTPAPTTTTTTPAPTTTTTTPAPTTTTTTPAPTTTTTTPAPTTTTTTPEPCTTTPEPTTSTLLKKLCITLTGDGQLLDLTPQYPVIVPLGQTLLMQALPVDLVQRLVLPMARQQVRVSFPINWNDIGTQLSFLSNNVKSEKTEKKDCKT